MSARRIVPAPRDAIYSFLSDLENQCLLTPDHTTEVALDGSPGDRRSGVVQIRGPLGMRRSAYARIVAAAEPSQLVTNVALGNMMVRLRWTLTPVRAGTGVELAAEIARSGLLARVRAAAGRGPARRRVNAALATLTEIVRFA